MRTDDFLAVLFKTALEDLDEGVDDPVNVSQSANMHLFAKSKKKVEGRGGSAQGGGEKTHMRMRCGVRVNCFSSLTR